MANSYAVQTLQDGPRNVIVKVTGVLDTADLTSQNVIDVSALSSVSTQGTTACRAVFVSSIEYDIGDGLIVNLWWDATTPVLIVPIYGRGKFNEALRGGFVNNSGAGKTGDITLTTSGFSVGTAVAFSFTLWGKKS